MSFEDLKVRQAEVLEQAKAVNAGRKPKFGDRMRNPWAGERNPHRDGYFVRSKRVTGRLNPGLWYEMTDGNGEFWNGNGDSMMFIDHISDDAHSGISPPAHRPHDKDSAVAVCAQPVPRAERIAQLQTEIAAHLAEDEPVADTLEAVAWGNMADDIHDHDRVLITDKKAAEEYHRQCYSLVPLHTADQVRRAVLAMQEAAAKIADEFTCGLCGIDGQSGRAIRALSADDIINQLSANNEKEK